ncbi:carboxymuconolactone decarboxylase family protein [Ornithinimicrobium sp. F0845]|uniref:carboxymuconolactone decarboxylase family protein n=1 Tax=Ornithinimicrobium sp. F0845 TaxID=2926412 RepID=UPI001FF4A616|nr:carboxymuconolactone decarboxylase family protein [Ornithinimicrobium sp. F0845]MCK0114221.1 carboxymuconolactone decarboxylase family protein [Ornithinimicrobium sp. F0845]
MGQDFDDGLIIRKKVMGEARVASALDGADDFSRGFQEWVTASCWGAVWGREGLSHKTRSMITVAMLAALPRPNELKLHVKGALRNGVTTEEIREVLMQVAVYAGAPTGVDGFRIAREAIEEYQAESGPAAT